MRVLPDVSFADHPPLDVVVVPGGEGTLLGSPNSAPMSSATCGGCATATW
jgi:hypothetical protein